MDHIGAALENTRRNIDLVGADPATRHGFTMVPNFILTNKDLSVGAKVVGPAVIEEYGSTIVVYPEWRAEVDPELNLKIVKS